MTSELKAFDASQVQDRVRNGGAERWFGTVPKFLKRTYFPDLVVEDVKWRLVHQKGQFARYPCSSSDSHLRPRRNRGMLRNRASKEAFGGERRRK